MKTANSQDLQKLKEKFQNLTPKKRETISISFLKVKLGVHSPQEIKTAKDFLGNLRIDLNPENMESLINFLHSDSHTLPEFLALEDSLTDIESQLSKNPKNDLPAYNPDEVETLRDGVKPFKS